MRPSDESPIVIAIPLDYGAQDVIDAAVAMAGRLGAPVLPVHAAHAGAEAPRLGETLSSNATIAAWLEPIVKEGIRVLPSVIEQGKPERLVPMVSARVGACATIVGSGRGATVRDWLLGTTAERIVRASAGPVWIARGTLPGPSLAVLVPTDLGEQTRLALIAGARWARLFAAPLRVLHVLPGVEPLRESSRSRAVDELEVHARARIADVIAQTDIDLPVEIRIAHGSVSAALRREAEEAGLVVIAQPDYEMLVPASLDSHVERLIRTSRASILAIRDDDVARQRAMREERASWVAALRTEAEAAMAEGDPARAERLLASAKIAAPASPKIEDILARAIEAQGRSEEADRHRALARWLRAELS